MQIDITWRANRTQQAARAERSMRDSIEAFFKYVPEPAKLATIRIVALRFERGGDRLGAQHIKIMPSVEHPHDPDVLPVLIHNEGSQGVLGFLGVSNMPESALRKLIECGPYLQKPRCTDSKDASSPSPASAVVSSLIANAAPAAPSASIRPMAVPSPASDHPTRVNGHADVRLTPQMAFEIVMEARGGSEVYAAAEQEHATAIRNVTDLREKAAVLKNELSALEEKLRDAEGAVQRAAEALEKASPTPEKLARIQAAADLLSKITAGVVMPRPLGR